MSNAICFASSPVSRLEFGDKMVGHHHAHMARVRLTTFTAHSVTLTEIQMNVVGFSGIVGIGWADGFLCWMQFKSNGGGRFGVTQEQYGQGVSRGI